jgi:hypothetical protein
MFSVKGTELDLMHMRVIRHVVNLAKSAEFGDKAQYLDIVHSMLQQLRDLIGIIRDCLSHKRPLTAKLKISTLTALLEKTSASGGSGAGNELLQTFSPLMDQTFLFMEIRRMTEELMADIEKMANITAIATGAWPPPEAVQNMIVKACELSCESKRMVMLANALGHWPIGSIDLEQKVFTDAVTEVPMPNDTTFVGGDEMSKSPKEKSATPQQIPETTSENTIDGDHAKNDAQKAVVDEALTAEDEGFFRSIEENIRRFVQTIQLLKEANFQKRKKELEPHAYTINYHADTIVEEIRSYELFKGDYDQNSNNEQQPSVERFRFDEDFKRLSEAVRLQSENLISKATLASGVWPPENASEQLKVAIATLAVVVKQMFTFAKQSTISMRQLLKTREQDEAAKRQAIDATLQERLKYNEYRKRNLGTFIGRGGWASGANSDQALAEQFRPTEKDILIAREKDGQVIIKGGKLARLVLQLVNPYENAGKFTF